MDKKNLMLPTVFGITAATALLLMYFVVMSLGSASFSFAVSELVRLRYFIIPLVLGFGLQIGLFMYLKQCQKNIVGEGKIVASSTTTSTVAMLACCAHHLTDILPLIGLTVLATALSKYQVWLLSLAIFSNLVGVLVMIRQIKNIKNG